MKITLKHILELLEEFKRWEETGEYPIEPPPQTPIPEVYLREFNEEGKL